MLRSFHTVNKLLHPLLKHNCPRNFRQEYSDSGCCKSSKDKESSKCIPYRVNKSQKESNERCPKPPKLPQIFDIACKNAVVVGGEDGIGYAAAHEILSNNAKMVGIFGKDVCKGVEACHALNCRFGQKKAVFFKVDVTCACEIECKRNKYQFKLSIFEYINPTLGKYAPLFTKVKYLLIKEPTEIDEMQNFLNNNTASKRIIAYKEVYEIAFMKSKAIFMQCD